MIDKDNNGQLHDDELAPHVIERADQNGDQLLTLEELKHGYEQLGLRLYDTPSNRSLSPRRIHETLSLGKPPPRESPNGQ